MPRGPRFVFQNAFYHVFNRGINKQEIFLRERDYSFFLKKLKNIKSKYDFSLYCVCLMPTHFHISIQTRKTPISKIMSSLATSYSMYFNKAYKHFGPVFQNRYKSILIQSDSYFLKLSQYIYLNPLKDGLVDDPINYKYSTLKEALGEKSLDLLDSDIIRLVGETKIEREKYRKYIYEGLKENFEDVEDVKSLFEKEEAVYGTSKFSSLARKKYLRRKNKRVSSLGRKDNKS